MSGVDNGMPDGPLAADEAVTDDELLEVEQALEAAGAQQQAAAALAAQAFDQGRDPAEIIGSAGSGSTDVADKFEALGVAIRAGVSPESAARDVGLPGLTFTGAVPTTLRVPESEAAGLEDA